MLVVGDDKRALANVNSELLAQEGYHVLTAYNAEQALKLLEENQIDIMFSDVIMPGKNGIELVKEV
ncbi:MAG: response regulator [Colwellia sp.]|nr:response regulator [Colwellia sp.]